MENFVFHIPTKAFFGKGQISQLASAIREHKGRKILLAYGCGSIKKYGIYDDVVAQLNSADLQYVELQNIPPNPPLEKVHEGMALFREHDCDFILGVGGGSTLDTCKAIAAGVAYDGDVMDLLSGAVEISNPAPIGTVLTLAGTGSEMDLGGVITAGPHRRKYVFMQHDLHPRFSILDPTYTFTVPHHYAMAACSDILSHLMEQYFVEVPGADTQNRIIEGLCKVVLDNAERILENPEDYDARSAIMWTSSLTLPSFHLFLGKPMFLFPVHYIGHELTSLYNMTHGVTLALITPAWMRYALANAPKELPLFARFARNVFGIQDSDDQRAAEKSIDALVEFYGRIGMPANLREAGVKQTDLAFLAERAAENGPLGFFAPMGEQEIRTVLNDAF